LVLFFKKELLACFLGEFWMRPLVAGNWKMNGLLRQAGSLASQLVAGSRDVACELLVCPPFTALSAVAAIVDGSAVGLGAQDCHAAQSGAHTGDIAAAMLADAGCRAVILGHSERRASHHESDHAVRAKVAAAWRAGLRPIVCVGETDDERDAGHEMAVVGRQVGASLPDDFVGDLAYEPIWAIGTGRTPSVEAVASMHAHIRSALMARLGEQARQVRILYGGSVNQENAATLLAVPEVDGALVGGASLNAAAFLAIAEAAGRLCMRGLQADTASA
jgi:triosephosphate isomerase